MLAIMGKFSTMMMINDCDFIQVVNNLDHKDEGS